MSYNCTASLSFLALFPALCGPFPDPGVRFAKLTAWAREPHPYWFRLLRDGDPN